MHFLEKSAQTYNKTLSHICGLMFYEIYKVIIV